MKQKIGQILLWISVVAWSLWFGGLMYELVVITPLWSFNLPESAIEWNSRSQYAIIPTKFYAPVAIVTISASLLGMILSWKSNSRWWLIISTVCAIVTLVFTLIYFFPKNEVLFHNHTAGLSGEEITAIGNAWVRGNWVRIGIMALGFFSALKAFEGSSKNKQ